MRQITREQLMGLLGPHPEPCISLYLPTHRQHPDNAQDPIRYRNLLAELETALNAKYPVREVRSQLEKFHPLSRDEMFWRHRTEGLAIFSAPDEFLMFELQRPVPELLVVADSFHVKPLIRIIQSADRYHVLCLNRHEAKLYTGNRDALDPVELTDVPSTSTEVLGDQRSEPPHMIGSSGSADRGIAVHHRHGSPSDEIENDMFRFFRAVDRGILEHHSRPSGLPLILAALPEYHEPFRRISHNPFLVAEGIMVNPDSLNLDQLRARAWEELQPTYLKRLEELKERFGAAQARQAGSSDLSDAARAAVAGQVETLLVDADRLRPGTLDRATGAIRSGNLSLPQTDDKLDDLAEVVLSKGGEVIIVPRERMPSTSGLAAIYRY